MAVRVVGFRAVPDGISGHWCVKLEYGRDVVAHCDTREEAEKTVSALEMAVLLLDAVTEHDNTGQIVIYTGVWEGQ